MSRADAELFYERIPSGAVDDSIPPRFSQANAVRLTNVRPKPEAVIERMARVAARYMLAGGLTEGDLDRAGFTAAQIRDHKAAAIARALDGMPGLQGLELPA